MTAIRRLAAILAADVAGYSRLIGADEEGTLDRLRSIRADVIDPKITENRGRIVKTTGDGLLVEFSSVVDALRCASEWQRGMAERNAAAPEDKRIQFRIGVHQGDIVVEDDDIFGDGVNVAARLEALAEPGGICVSARVQEDVAGRLDLTFEDMGEQSLKNIARPVRVFRARLASAESTRKVTPIESGPELTLPDKPSIAVLPFANMSADAEQDYFADGMVEEIITALSRIRWLFAIARNSSFTYKGQRVDVKQVGRELGIRYVLEGSVRKAGGRVRVTAQLIEAVSGVHLWADRFDGTLEDVFDLQDKVAISVAGVIEPALQGAEIVRSANRPTNDLIAYDLYLRGSYAPVLTSGKQIPQALAFLEQAIDRDPRYGPALAWAAVCCLRLCSDGLSKDPEGDRRKGTEFARSALQVASDDPGTLANAALVLANFGEDIGAMIALVDRALTLNSGYARGWYISAVLRLQAGECGVAIEHAETSIRLSPRAPFGAPLYVVGAALFCSRRFDDAIPKLLLGIQDLPSFAINYRVLAACYAHMGRLNEAREVIKRLTAITPVVMPDPRIRYLRNPDHLELLLSGLRLAIGEKT